MSRHTCRSEQCGYCEDRIDAVIEARTGLPRNTTQRELDRMADDQAEKECGPR